MLMTLLVVKLLVFAVVDLAKTSLFAMEHIRGILNTKQLLLHYHRRKRCKFLMKRLLQLIHALESHIPNKDIKAPAVSAGALGWHIEHSLLVITQIIEGVKRSDPKKYKWVFNFKRLVILGSNKIPRGKAKAPDSVRPKEDIDELTILESIAKARNSLNELLACPKNSYFIHPYFGQLNKAATIRFFEVHTKHHLKIIQDILNNK